MVMAFPNKEQLEDSLRGLVKEFGLVIEDIKITKAGAKSAIRIAVDTADPRAERPGLDQLEDGDDVVLITPGKKQPSVRRVRFADVAGAVVEVEFSQAPAAEADLVGLAIDAYGLPRAEDQQDSPVED